MSFGILSGLVFGVFRYRAENVMVADVSVPNGGFEYGVQGNGIPNGWGYWPDDPADNVSGVTTALKAEGDSSFRFVFSDKEQGLYNNVALRDCTQAYEVTYWVKAEKPLRRGRARHRGTGEHRNGGGRRPRRHLSKRGGFGIPQPEL